MPDLLQCQLDLAGALSDVRASPRALRWLSGDTALTARRLAIYRANVESAATKALVAAYPVIRRVIGEERFDDLARAYQRNSPSRSGDLHELGSDFAGLLADHQDTRSLPYLPDLARLEWAAHWAYGAADAPAFDSRALAQLPVHRQSMIRFAWSPGTALIVSPFPIVRIWHIHQADFDGEFSVDWSRGEIALVAREGLRVNVHAMSAGDAAFIAASLSGAALGVAAERALVDEPAFDLAGLLRRLMATNVICGFSADKEQP